MRKLSIIKIDSRNKGNVILVKNGFRITCLLFVLVAQVQSTADNSATPYKDGVWVSPKASSQIPKLRVEVNSANKKVYFTLFKRNKAASDSVGITFVGANGKKTLVELKAMDPQFPQRYDGTLARMEPFLGFEIKIPFGSTKPKSIHSRQLSKTKE